MKKLTESQQKIYDYLKKASSRGVPPTVREICEATGFSSTSTVHSHLKTLEKYGYITRDDGKNRSLTLAGVVPTTPVPVVGTVTAGLPILAVEDIESYIPYPSKGDEELFALRVKGYSMKNAGILDSDIVVCKKTETAEDGEIVVALIEDEATVKRFFHDDEKGCIRLQPENPDFEPIYAQDVAILGRVISLQRYY